MNMTVPKIVKLVSVCKDCPHYNYYSGWVFTCSKADQIVIHKELVAPFCPLPDYPSKVIADMEMTIIALREPNQYSMDFALLSYVASKFKANIGAHGRGSVLALDEGKEVYLSLDHIEKISLNPSEIRFHCGNGVFRACLGGKDPALYKLSTLDEETKKELWYQII
jgi:hypothetical protein